MRRYRHLLANLFLIPFALHTNSCSNDAQKEEPTEEIAASAEAAPAEAPSADKSAPASTPSPAVKEEIATPALPEGPALAEPPASALPEKEEKVAEEPEAAIAPAAALPDGSRRVWFVTVDKALVKSTPSDKGKTVGAYNKGDHFLATERDGWVMISENKFVSLKQLSKKPVGRGAKKSNSWNEEK